MENIPQFKTRLYSKASYHDQFGHIHPNGSYSDEGRPTLSLGSPAVATISLKSHTDKPITLYLMIGKSPIVDERFQYSDNISTANGYTTINIGRRQTINIKRDYFTH